MNLKSFRMDLQILKVARRSDTIAQKHWVKTTLDAGGPVDSIFNGVGNARQVPAQLEGVIGFNR